MSVQVLTAKLGQLKELVTIEQAIDCTIIKPREYIPTPDWTKINAIARQEGGKWIGAKGQIGEWKVPLIKPIETDDLLFSTNATHGFLELDFKTLLEQGYKKLTVRWEK